MQLRVSLSLESAFLSKLTINRQVCLLVWGVRIMQVSANAWSYRLTLQCTCTLFLSRSYFFSTSLPSSLLSCPTTGNININQWEAVEPTLFPPSLLPLINFVISSLTPHSRHTFTKAHSSSSSPLSLNSMSSPYTVLAIQSVHVYIMHMIITTP